MNNRVLIGSIVVLVSLFLAWKIGLWLEPGPAEKAAVATPATTQEPPFAKGQVRETVNYELRNVTAAPDGKSVDGFGVVRFDIERSDIKPAAVAMLKVLKEKFPAAERMTLIMIPFIECPSCGIAEVAFERGTVTLRYGTPTLAQIEEWNRSIGVAAGQSDDRPLLVRPSGEALSMGRDVMKAIDAARRKNPGMNEEQLLDEAAAATGLSYVVIKRHRDFMTAYFSGHVFGSETFEM